MKNNSLWVQRASEALNRPRQQKLIFGTLLLLFGFLFLLLILINNNHDNKLILFIGIMALFILIASYVLDIECSDDKWIWPCSSKRKLNKVVYAMVYILYELFVPIGTLIRVIKDLISLCLYFFWVNIQWYTEKILRLAHRP